LTTLRDEDITTRTNTLPDGDADQSDSNVEQADPAGVDTAGSDADGSDSDSSDSDSSDSGTETHTEITVEPRRDDADSSDS
jgi:hypothetical protein